MGGSRGGLGGGEVAARRRGRCSVDVAFFTASIGSRGGLRGAGRGAGGQGEVRQVQAEVWQVQAED